MEFRFDLNIINLKNTFWYEFNKNSEISGCPVNQFQQKSKNSQLSNSRSLKKIFMRRIIRDA